MTELPATIADRDSEAWINGWLASEDSEHDKISVKRAYIDINDGNLIDGLIFSQIMYWHGRSKETGKRRLQIYKDGYYWLAKRHEDWWEECRIDTRQARDSINRIEKRGLIVKKLYKFNGAPVVHVRIDWNSFVASIRLLASNPIGRICQIHSTVGVNSLTETTGKDQQSETPIKTRVLKAISEKSLDRSLSENSSNANQSKQHPDQTSQSRKNSRAKKSSSTPVNKAETQNKQEDQGSGKDIPPAEILRKNENPLHAVKIDSEGFAQMPTAKQYRLPRAIATRRIQALLSLDVIPDCLSLCVVKGTSTTAAEGRQYVLCDFEDREFRLEDEVFAESGRFSLRRLRNLAIAKGVIEVDSWNWLIEKIFSDSVDWCKETPNASEILERDSVLKIFHARDQSLLS